MDIIKYTQLSRLLSGSDNSIRSNKIPEKYKDKVDLLKKLIEAWKDWAVQD